MIVHVAVPVLEMQLVGLKALRVQLRDHAVRLHAGDHRSDLYVEHRYIHPFTGALIAPYESIIAKNYEHFE